MNWLGPMSVEAKQADFCARNYKIPVKSSFNMKNSNMQFSRVHGVSSSVGCEKTSEIFKSKVQNDLYVQMSFGSSGL